MVRNMPKQHLKLKQIKPNQAIYHYTKSNGVQGILGDMAFYATKSDFLNDTKEMYYTLYVVDQVIKEIKDLKMRKLLKNKLDQHLDILEKQWFFITSFSDDPDSITLWAEFGDKTGYNLEFNSTELLERIRDNRRIVHHGYLIYSWEEQKAIIRDLLFEKAPQRIGMPFKQIMYCAENDVDAICFNSFCKEFLEVISIYSLFFKQEEFAAEREYRMVFIESDPEKIEFRAKDGFLMPYIKIDVKGEKSFIKKITVAPKNHVDLAKAGMELFSQHYGYDVEVMLSKIHLRY